MTAKKDYKTIVLDPKYSPKKTEKYMSDEQKAYFYQMLMRQRRELDEDGDDPETLVIGQKLDSAGAIDEGDAATLAIDTDLSIKLQERSNAVKKQIDAALARLEDGTYGYSLLSGDEIGIKRLMVRPIATITMEEKEATER